VSETAKCLTAVVFFFVERPIIHWRTARVQDRTEEPIDNDSSVHGQSFAISTLRRRWPTFYRQHVTQYSGRRITPVLSELLRTCFILFRNTTPDTHRADVFIDFTTVLRVFHSQRFSEEFIFYLREEGYVFACVCMLTTYRQKIVDEFLWIPWGGNASTATNHSMLVLIWITIRIRNLLCPRP